MSDAIRVDAPVAPAAAPAPQQAQSQAKPQTAAPVAANADNAQKADKKKRQPRGRGRAPKKLQGSDAAAADKAAANAATNNAESKEEKVAQRKATPNASRKASNASRKTSTASRKSSKSAKKEQTESEMVRKKSRVALSDRFNSYRDIKDVVFHSLRLADKLVDSNEKLAKEQSDVKKSSESLLCARYIRRNLRESIKLASKTDFLQINQKFLAKRAKSKAAREASRASRKPAGAEGEQKVRAPSQPRVPETKKAPFDDSDTFLKNCIQKWSGVAELYQQAVQEYKDQDESVIVFMQDAAARCQYLVVSLNKTLAAVSRKDFFARLDKARNKRSVSRSARKEKKMADKSAEQQQKEAQQSISKKLPEQQPREHKEAQKDNQTPQTTPTAA